MKPVELTLQLVKSTKGTHVYNDTSPGAAVPTLYIKKDSLPNPPPATVTITIGVP